MLEFDEDGNLLANWGGADGPGYEWPDSNHGITVDYKGNVWIGGNGRGAAVAPAPANESQNTGGGPREPHYHDSMILKFTQDGKFLMQIGKPGQARAATTSRTCGLPAKIFVDPKTNEVYVADGYGNHRVIVFDAESGKYKRHWGAYGHKPDDADLGPYKPDAPPAQQFRNPVHCAELSNDGCSTSATASTTASGLPARRNVRQEKVLHTKNTLGDGSVWDIAFSKDPPQKYSILADGSNKKIHILDRETLDVLTSFGEAAGSRANSTPSTASRPILKATSSPPKHTAGSACRSLYTRASRR